MRLKPMTRAQAKFEQINKELNLTNITRRIFEFKLLTKSQIKQLPNYISTAFGGIKVVVEFPNNKTYEFVLFLEEDNVMVYGYNQPYQIYSLKSITDIERYINELV